MHKKWKSAIPNIPAHSGVLDKQDTSSGRFPLRKNRFEVIADLMEEEVDLLGLNNGKEMVRVGDSAPMDATVTPSPPIETLISTEAHPGPSNSAQPIPPPAMSTTFVKPKPSKKKTKVLGPIPKETKIIAQKPYDLPPLPKKQTNRTPKMLPSIQSPPSQTPSALCKPPLLQSSSPEDLGTPSVQIPTSPNPAPPSVVSTSRTKTALPQASHAISPAVVQNTATLPTVSSQ
ncbi:hypothetical protein SLA2020_251930 [Shorea laevis]